MNPFTGGWVILMTLLIAMTLAVFRLPDGSPEWLGWFRPSWVLLILFFWVMELPHRIGLIAAWFMGLLMDGLQGEPLGLNGFLLASFTYVTWRFFERLRMYSVLQQCGVVLVLILLAQLVRAGTLYLASNQPFGFAMFGTVLSSTLLWPFIYLLLMRIRTSVRIE